MKLVLDTNVLVSGIFFGGVPGRILTAWAEGGIVLVLSPASGWSGITVLTPRQFVDRHL